MNEDLFIILY